MRNNIALPSFVLGYHGCDNSVAERVLAGKEVLRPHPNSYDWLGHGIYFWEHNPKRAMEWAIGLQARKKIETPAVLGAIIDLGNCLNLLDSSGLKTVEHAYKKVEDLAKRSGQPLPVNKPLRDSQDLLLRELDCHIINFIHKLHDDDGAPIFNYDTVRAVFVEGGQLYPNAGFHAKNHIQICVRDNTAIKSYFRVHTAETCSRVNPGDKSCREICGLICLE